MKIALVSTVLINVITCFVVLVGILIIHSLCLKNEKQFFLYEHIFVGPPLIKITHLLILDTFFDLRSTIWIPPRTYQHCEEYALQSRGVPYNYRVREKETKSFDVQGRPFLVVCWDLGFACQQFVVVGSSWWFAVVCW